MITEIVGVLTELIAAIFTIITSGANSLVGVFYDVTASELTFWGTMAFIGLGLGLAFFVVRWIRSLIAR